MAKGWLEALLGKAQKFVDAREEELSRMRGVDRLYIFGAGATSRQVLAQLLRKVFPYVCVISLMKLFLII